MSYTVPQFMGEFDIQQFENAARDNGVHFWYAHEFMKIPTRT
jgi:hypothetical protein